MISEYEHAKDYNARGMWWVARLDILLSGREENSLGVRGWA